MTTSNISSWGGITAHRQTILEPVNHEDLEAPRKPYLATGNSRSYGDTCLPAEGMAIDTRTMNRVLRFDADNGILRAESGILLADILDLVIPHGWFLPVTPGTRHVTLGGALANDVHGKNHHGAGTFGRHVRAFELLRSNGVRMVCSPGANAGYYAATIGGMGLTGIITWVEFSLMQIGRAHV